MQCEQEVLFHYNCTKQTRGAGLTPAEIGLDPKPSNLLRIMPAKGWFVHRLRFFHPHRQCDGVFVCRVRKEGCQMQKSRTVRLTESAVALAMATVLSMIKVVEMPYGGSVTAASMLPLILIAYRHGTAWGLFTGFTASVLQLILGANNLSWATSMAAAIAIVFLDYILAFSVTGLGGIFRKSMNQPTALGISAFLICLLRYLFHVVSGCTAWEGVSIPTGDALVYSIGYNAVYMVPETLITVAAAVLLGRMLDFSKQDIGMISRTAKSKTSVAGALSLLVAGIVDVFLLFSATQVENAAGEVVFDITGIADANWWLIAAITLVAITVFVSPQKIAPYTTAYVALATVLVGMIMEIELLLLISFAAIAAVVALLLAKQAMLSAIAAPLLFDGIYLWQILSVEGYEWSIEDYAALIIPIVCGALAVYALLARKKHIEK